MLTDLLETYNRLERPVQNETEAVILYFGLTLQQIIDVVRGAAAKNIQYILTERTPPHPPVVLS